jgi:hypothetical protein
MRWNFLTRGARWVSNTFGWLAVHLTMLSRKVIFVVGLLVEEAQVPQSRVCLPVVRGLIYAGPQYKYITTGKQYFVSGNMSPTFLSSGFICTQTSLVALTVITFHSIIYSPTITGKFYFRVHYIFLWRGVYKKMRLYYSAGRFSHNCRYYATRYTNLRLFHFKLSDPSQYVVTPIWSAHFSKWV